MLTGDRIVYQLDFVVEDRQQFEEWFPNATVEWATLPGVRSFRVFRGVDGVRKRVMLAFAFEEYADWRRFSQHDTHRDNVATVESVGTHVRTTLWAPAAVTLAGDRPAVREVPDRRRRGAPEDSGAVDATTDAVPEP